MQSADRRRLRVYARVLRLPVLLVDAAAARRRGGRVPAADARRRGCGRGRPEGHLERDRSDRYYGDGHPQGAPGVVARQGREDRRARDDPLPSRRRDSGPPKPPRQVPQRATLQVASDANETEAQETEGPRDLRRTAAPGVRVADGRRQERQVGPRRAVTRTTFRASFRSIPFIIVPPNTWRDCEPQLGLRVADTRTSLLSTISSSCRAAGRPLNAPRMRAHGVCVFTPIELAKRSIRAS